MSLVIWISSRATKAFVKCLLNRFGNSLSEMATNRVLLSSGSSFTMTSEGPVVEGLSLLLVHEHEDGQDWESFVRRVASKADIPDCQGADIKVADLGKQGQQGHFYYYPLLSSIIQYYPLSSHIELGVVADTLKAPALFEGDLH